MLTRRQLLARGARAGAAAALLPAACRWQSGGDSGTWVNDVHSQLNRTRVRRLVRPRTPEALQSVVREARAEGRSISVAGGRHAMGGQQFAADSVLVDASDLAGVLAFDAEAGQVEVGAGSQWPQLIDDLLRLQRGRERQWGIVQKQTGADRLSIGGALAANAHGRGLVYPPMVGDVEAFTLVDAQGELRRCSRRENAELFRLVIGGYGLFGILASVRLRLAPRRKLERVVEVAEVSGLAERFEERIRQGFLFGDFQYSTDPAAKTLLRRGVFSCYRPVDPGTPIPEGQARLSREAWLSLIQLAHGDRTSAFERYSGHYVSTSGQIYWSDLHQLSTYIDDYHRVLGERIGALGNGTEMISEIYVPRGRLAEFLEDVRADFLEHDVDLIYGTIRLIERDDETFLAWAREPWACVIFNLHASHDPEGLRKTEADFRRLIDRGIDYGGSYFLTYHRWATREQVLACYPQLPQFLELKRKYDPEERFQSDWYRHYRAMFA
jgi:FAD/FMN-containing dehydrogenase